MIKYNKSLKLHLKNTKNFCAKPFLETVYWYDGVVKPCCIYNSDTGDSKHSNLLVDDITIKESWSTFDIVKIRELMIEGKRVSGCSRCWNEEDQDCQSDRQRYTDHVLSALEANKTDITIDTTYGNLESKAPVRTEVRSSNACNMSCRMCFSSVSDKLRKEEIDNLEDFKKSDWYDYYAGVTGGSEILKISDSGTTNWLTTKRFEELIELSKEVSTSDLSDKLYNLPNYILVGGEPFVMPGMIKFLEKLVDMGNAKNLRLNISTNLSLINNKMLKFLGNFKSIFWSTSIDGTKDVHEYIRNHKSFNDIIKHHKLLSGRDEYFTITHALSILNINDVSDFLKYMAETGILEDGKRSIAFNVVENPDLVVWNLPYEIRLKIKEDISETLNGLRDTGYYKSLTWRIDDILYRLGQKPEFFGKTEEQVNFWMENFCIRMRQLDKIRNQNLLDIDKDGFFERIFELYESE
jgi:sulfatase maturation enzyme AslB (radical SAM superfamily)